MYKTLTPLLLWVVATGCKTDVGPKKKVASAKLRAHTGKLWNEAHVLALRRVKKGRYGGRGGFGSYKRGYMRYYLVLDGVGKGHRIFLYEAQYRQEKGKGLGVDKLTLRASADDRCVAYSNDGGKRWRFVRWMGKDTWFHLSRPEVNTSQGHKDPCASAPTAEKHFLAQLVGSHKIYPAEMRGVLKVLALNPDNHAYHLAFAQFMLTQGRRQYFHPNLTKQWRPVQKIACQKDRLRRVYAARIKAFGFLGTRHHRNAMLVLEHCPRAEIQDRLSNLLWSKATYPMRDEYRLVAARCFARITEARRGMTPKALADALKALPTAKPRIQAYIARALGALGDTTAHVALKTLIGQIEAKLDPGATTPSAPKGHWPAFDKFVKRVKNTRRKDEKHLVLRTARAALKR